MNHKIILFSLFFTLINVQLIGSTEPITENKFVEESMTLEVDGAVKLYSISKEDIELIDTEFIQETDERVINNWQLATNKDYFISYESGKIEAISPKNFKRITKKYFADLPALATSIGKRGFRYKNLPTMILFYNKQMQEGKALTKADQILVQKSK
ncbi:MAG: hypothetical protein AB8G22_27200 [Saprospiraceae bacterium]